MRNHSVLSEHTDKIVVLSQLKGTPLELVHL